MHNLNLQLLKAEFTKALEDRHVFAALANNSFSGEINQKNDRVKMIEIGAIDVNSYVDGTDITDQDLVYPSLEIIADQDNYFSYVLDTLEYNNNKNGILNESGRKAAYAMNDTIDSNLASLYASAQLTNTTYTNASPLDMTSLNVEEAMLDMNERFLFAGVPGAQRKVAIVPPWVQTKLTLAGVSSKTDNDELYASAFLGTGFGWDFVLSNNVSMGTASTGAKTRIMFVVPGQTLGYADAVSTMETAQMEAQIGKTKVKGRHIHGYKMVRPDMGGVLYADKTAEA